MPQTNVSADWSGGDLYLKDASGNSIAKIDGTNRALDIPSGSAFKIAGTAVTTALATAPAAVAAGYKIARGTTALDGSNPTPVTTGLSTVVAATVSLEGSSAPGVGTSVLTVATTNYATGALAVYAWKVTGTGDATLIASTGTETFEWIAIGT